VIQITSCSMFTMPARMLRNLSSSVLDFVYPVHCPVCRASMGPGDLRICSECWQNLQVITGVHCSRCGCPGDFRNSPCSNCSDKVFRFTRLRALAPFTEPMQQLVYGIKYQNRTGAARILGKKTGDLLNGDTDVGDLPDTILPVPLHPSRRRERGYNQSSLIGREIARAL